jgi:hypothetical protein
MTATALQTVAAEINPKAEPSHAEMANAVRFLAIVRGIIRSRGR